MSPGTINVIHFTLAISYVTWHSQPLNGEMIWRAKLITQTLPSSSVLEEDKVMMEEVKEPLAAESNCWKIQN